MIGGRRVALGEKPTEIWVYRNLFTSLQRPHEVRLIFVDAYSTGDYKLATNLDEVIPGTMGMETEFAPNLAFTHELHKEEAERARAYFQRALFNFSWEFVKKRDKESGSTLLICIALPYDKILFAKVEGRLKAKMVMGIQLKSDEKIIWQFREDILDQVKGEDWKLDIPVTKRLDKGKYSIYMRLQNTSGDQKVEKLLPLKM